MKYILAIDQGTSSTRACIFNEKGKIISISQRNITLVLPEDGWVEQSPQEIWEKTLIVIKEVIQKSGIHISDIVSTGLANQRETTLIWDKTTGKVIGNAIVWSDRRTVKICEDLREYQTLIKEKTGLLLDPYFSATKIQWLMNRYPEAKKLAKDDKLAFGTIDSFLIWRLSAGRSHVTDITNAQRTLLFNLNKSTWDEELCQLFGITSSMLPEVKSCNAHFADIDKSLLGHSIPITGVAGDQQAALIGQACFKKGMVKVTYGTGAFLLLNTGDKLIRSDKGLLTTIAYQINDQTVYGLEGSIFNTGTVIKWMRDTLGIINSPAETEQLANSLDNNGGVYLVPGFTGLGAPYWAPHVKASFLGMQLDTDRRHFARAALESVAYQTHDLLQAMGRAVLQPLTEIRVDGGMVVNNWLLQCIADTCHLTIKKPLCNESTARGAAFLAGLGCGLYGSLDEVSTYWEQDKCFIPDSEKDKAKNN
jgi:glycerol kinase